MKASITALAYFLLGLLFGPTSAFVALPSCHVSPTTRDPHSIIAGRRIHVFDKNIQLNMIGRLFRRDRLKKKVQTLERPKEKTKKKEKDPLWRVMLYNTDWQPDITARLLVKVIPALDRAAAFELVCRARSMGKAALVITRKKQAEAYCLGLQRQGLPATIEPHDVER